MLTSVRPASKWGLCFTSAVLAIASTALGDIVSVQIAGEVTYSDFATIGIGTPVTGLYTYDDTLVPIVPNPYNAWYGPISAGLSFVDGSSVSSDEAEIFVNNNSSGIGSTDVYGVRLDVPPSSGTMTGAFAGYSSVDGWMLARMDPTGTAWNGIALPDPQTILALLPDDGSILLFRDPDYYLKVMDFEITDLSVVPVPAPSALLLGLIGLASCGRLVKRRTT